MMLFMFSILINEVNVAILNVIFSHHQTAPMTRVDKADILELTVFHLTQLQQQQRSATMATEAAAYDTGFKDCARETMTFITSNRITGESKVSLLNIHLHASFLMKSRKHHHSGGVQHFGGNLSTPIRPAEVTNVFSSSDLLALGCSPILPSMNNTTYVETSSGSASGSFDRNSDTESLTCSMSLSTDSGLSHTDDVTSSRTVSIGDGEEDEIGHVIKEQVWRPW